MMIAGIKKEHLSKVKKLTEEMSKVMSSIEDDGVGYASITNTGKIFGEKWVNKDDAFKLHHQPEPDASVSFMEKLFNGSAKWKNPASNDPIYESFGNRRELMNDTVALILHARKKTTGEKGINNTHPFYVLGEKDIPDTALIHNGSILNHESLTKKTSTCDSEVILHEYLDHMIYYNPMGVEAMVKQLVGEYAVGVLSSIEFQDETVLPILDIFKSNKPLYAGFVPEIETVVFCTNDYTLNDGVKNAGMTLKNIVEISDGHLIRLNAITGERYEDVIKFEPGARTVYGHHNGYYDRSNHSNHVRTMEHHRPNAAERSIQATVETANETMEDVKRNFEKNHGDLFSQAYHEVSGGLTTDERDYYTRLEADGKTDFKALRLVEKALNLKV